ncbi:hypothetical protein [Sporomusa malonica]|uniref:hypothetical protein n=1 Tax=Sporomusa malonica TaxID=112901 RepID=UPI00111C0F70|nr:hypothetical protein [Sporomusa malonica]
MTNCVDVVSVDKSAFAESSGGFTYSTPYRKAHKLTNSNLTAVLMILTNKARPERRRCGNRRAKVERLDE